MVGKAIVTWPDGYLADMISFQIIFSLSGLGCLVSTLIFVWFVVRAVSRHQTA
jgi:fucose permease